MNGAEPDDALGLRPLTARSVIASTLLGTHPPRLPTGVLVSAARLFGVSDSAARTALSRMVAAGEVTAEDGSHRLAGDLLDRQERQDVGRSARRLPWSGAWTLVVLSGGARTAPTRARHREALKLARLGEVRDGVWTRPDNLGRAVLAEIGWATVGVLTVDGEPGWDVGDLWDLDDWRGQAAGLRTEVARLTPGLEAGDEELLARGFVVSAAVLRLFQRDPLLPDELLPADWPGDSLRADYDRFDLAYRAVLKGWFARQGR
ncbi:MAG: PaaX domain-containing protein, C- domain protein [Acidimicrobiia bacterium]|nr:PaaX domain-containing protein, C- domain protein [Acidimicrobiia bacterium]